MTLIVNGIPEATKRVTLGAGASTTVEFGLSKSEAGTYEVDLNGTKSSFTVKAAEPVPLSVQPTQDPQQEDMAPLPAPSRVNWGLIIGIIAGVAILSGGVFTFLKMRQRSKQGNA